MCVRACVRVCVCVCVCVCIAQYPDLVTVTENNATLSRCKKTSSTDEKLKHPRCNDNYLLRAKTRLSRVRTGASLLFLR